VETPHKMTRTRRTVVHQDPDHEGQYQAKRQNSYHQAQNKDRLTYGHSDSDVDRRQSEKEQASRHQGQRKRSYQQQETLNLHPQGWNSYSGSDRSSDAPVGKRHKSNVHVQVSQGETKARHRPFGTRPSGKRPAIQIKKEPVDRDDDDASVVSSRSRSARSDSVASSRSEVQKSLSSVLKAARNTARKY
jgi:hypothetical protein